MVSQLKYKFCFVINGNPVIDPQYPHTFYHGEYLNVINIKEIQDQELFREIKYESEKEEYFSSSSASTSETNSSSNESEEDNSSSPLLYPKNDNYKSLTPKAKKVQKYGMLVSFLGETKPKDDITKSSSVKSILKELKSFITRKPSSSKRVSFGKVETCCRSLIFV